MINFSKKIAGFFLRTAQDAFEVTTLKERYKQFRISLLFAITIIALIPASTLAVIGYFQYLGLAEKQSATYIRWHLQYISNNLQAHLSTIVKQVNSMAAGLSPPHIDNSSQLELLLTNMQQEERSLTNLEIIKIDENLPPPHPPANWFHSALPEGLTISDMQFKTGKSPYFIVSLQHELKTSSADLLIQATFDGGSLEKLVKDLNADAVEDAFLINNNSVLQSTSAFFGAKQNRYPIATPVDRTHFTSVSKTWGMGKTLFASTPIPKTPWTLVLIKDGPVQKKEWLTFQLTLILTFLVCASGSFFIINQLVNLLTLRIRESDTKRMALLNEVGHTNRLATIGKFAAGVAHEINNPLAVIDQKAGLIDDLLEISKDFNHKEKLEATLKGIHSSVDRCKVITHRLLGFARKMESINELLNINSIVKEVMGFLEKEALFSHIVFDMQFEENLPEIWSDRGQLQQIFINIISNSIDAIKKNGLIKISTSMTSKDTILVEIRDNGPGIPHHIMEHIFDPFFTTKETGEGTGLGLSITYGLVKKLGGDIKVHSIVGEGVTFYIYLPTTSSEERDDHHG